MDVVRTSQALTAPRPPRPTEAPRPEAAAPEKAKAPAPPETSLAMVQVDEGIVVDAGLFKIAQSGEPQPSEETKGASEESAESRVSEMVKDLNSKLEESKQTRIRFTVDSESGNVVIQVVDKVTDEVVRSIPPEEMIALKKRMTEMRGILFDREG